MRIFLFIGEFRLIKPIRFLWDLRISYPSFYWGIVSRYIQEALHYLRVTQEGKQWIANLYSHVFASEHKEFHNLKKKGTIAKS